MFAQIGLSVHFSLSTFQYSKFLPGTHCHFSMGGISGLVVAGVAGAVGVGISMAAIPFVTPALRKVCIPYVPATAQQLQHVSQALSTIETKAPLVDLGSGDGRVVGGF